MILSTKNKYKKVLFIPIIMTILNMTLYVFYINFFWGYGCLNLITLLNLMTIISAICGGFFAGTYIDVYEDHIDGNFLCKFIWQKRYIKREQIKEATIIGQTYVRIHTEEGTYTIVTNPELANKVYDYINKEYIKK